MVINPVVGVYILMKKGLPTFKVEPNRLFPVFGDWNDPFRHISTPEFQLDGCLPNCRSQNRSGSKQKITGAKDFLYHHFSYHLSSGDISTISCFRRILNHESLSQDPHSPIRMANASSNFFSTAGLNFKIYHEMTS